MRRLIRRHMRQKNDVSLDRYCSFWQSLMSTVGRNIFAAQPLIPHSLCRRLHFFATVCYPPPPPIVPPQGYRGGEQHRHLLQLAGSPAPQHSSLVVATSSPTSNGASTTASASLLPTNPPHTHTHTHGAHISGGENSFRVNH